MNSTIPSTRVDLRRTCESEMQPPDHEIHRSGSLKFPGSPNHSTLVGKGYTDILDFALLTCCCCLYSKCPFCQLKITMFQLCACAHYIQPKITIFWVKSEFVPLYPAKKNACSAPAAQRVWAFPMPQLARSPKKCSRRSRQPGADCRR